MKDQSATMARRGNARSANSSGIGVIGCAAAFIGAIALGLFAIVLAFIIGGSVTMYQQAALIDRAVGTPGRIVSSEVEEQTYVASPKTDHNVTGRTKTTFLPAISYTYEFDGNEYRGVTVFPFPQTGDEAWAKSVVRKFQPEEEVTVWVDSEDPSKAFLVRGYVAGPYVAVLAGSICLCILMAILTLVAFPMPKVSRLLCAVGILGAIVPAANAYAHFLFNARGDVPTLSVADGLAVGVATATILPLFARRQAKKWFGRMQRESEPAGG